VLSTIVACHGSTPGCENNSEPCLTAHHQLVGLRCALERGHLIHRPHTGQSAEAHRILRINRAVEREIPEPGTGSVRIKVQACGICHSDSLTKEGNFPSIQYSRVPGNEVAGLVDTVGPGVAGWTTGQRVGVVQKAVSDVLPEHIASYWFFQWKCPLLNIRNRLENGLGRASLWDGRLSHCLG
jgi:hypothetical protein